MKSARAYLQVKARNSSLNTVQQKHCKIFCAKEIM